MLIVLKLIQQVPFKTATLSSTEISLHVLWDEERMDTDYWTDIGSFGFSFFMSNTALVASHHCPFDTLRSWREFLPLKVASTTSSSKCVLRVLGWIQRNLLVTPGTRNRSPTLLLQNFISNLISVKCLPFLTRAQLASTFKWVCCVPSYLELDVCGVEGQSWYWHVEMLVPAFVCVRKK